MNVTAIDATSARKHAPPAAAASEAPRKAPPPRPASAPVSVAALSTPAATSTITSVPASVKPEDRALYMQILKALGGNVSAALAALQAKEASEQSG